MFPANVPNYPPFGSVPGVETFQPEEAACFGKFLGEPPPPACRVPTLLYHWALRGAQSCAGLAPPRWPPLPGRCSLASPRSSLSPCPHRSPDLDRLDRPPATGGGTENSQPPPYPLSGASPVGVESLTAAPEGEEEGAWAGRVSRFEIRFLAWSSASVSLALVSPETPLPPTHQIMSFQA
ncbi:unnamed protein product [Rangifer tarandus platyrhynchus]|uniref:Uncharacterized protein n=1 Tax=Rangifer tarandus platyrhynchus TaxID=3082113 RepID=A0ABN8Z8W7_RANTA|nr:unnamed protein product [Rangifer tarandus platyrhynchus]